jgi:membrane associated rhomboid family serine protease
VYFLFFFPVGTDSRPGRRPWGTTLLLLVLCGAFALRFVRPEVAERLTLAAFRPSDPTLSGALLSLFLHAGWLHLAGNGLYLWIFGRQLEARLGFAPLAALFVLGGIVSCWFQAWLTPESSWSRELPLVGASGSVAAILGATLVRFHHQRVRVLWFVFALIGGLTRGGVSLVNTVVATLLWFVLQVVQLGVAWDAGGAPVAYAAHAGGFLAGMTMALLLGLHRGPRREIHFERGRRYFERSDWYAACGELTSHLEIVPGDREAGRMRARCLVLLGSQGEAAAEYLRLFHAARGRGDVVEAASLYREMRVYGLGCNLTAQELLRLAQEFQAAGRPGEAAEIYRETLASAPAGPVADLAAIRRAEILWSELGRYEEARACYRDLLESGSAGEWRELAEARLRSMDVLSGGSVSAGPGTPRLRAPRSAPPPRAA